MDLSIIVPCYNEQESLPIFYKAITDLFGEGGEGQASVARCASAPSMRGVQAEFIFVDDGSIDATMPILQGFADFDARVKYVSFSRNFGKESAIYAGLEASTGNYIAIMDADMQDSPSLMPMLYKCVCDGECEIARVRRTTRNGEPMLRSFFARSFYKTINRFTDIEIADGSRDFQVMTRQVADAILSMHEYNRFFKGISSWVGYKTKWFEHQNEQRAAGETKWSFTSLAKYAMQGITSFTAAPLNISSATGIFCFLLAVVFIVFIIVRKILFGDPVSGWASTICIILLLGGLQLLCIGILGQYLAKTYLETKHRPIYLVAKTNVVSLNAYVDSGIGTRHNGSKSVDSGIAATCVNPSKSTAQTHYVS